MPRKSLRARIEERAQERCEYCHAPQMLCGYRFHLEHIIPIAAGGSDEDANRALACATCNLTKSDHLVYQDTLTGEETPLFHPRLHVWTDHFAWEENQQTLVGRTAIGRVTVTALNMNSDLQRSARLVWFAIGWLPKT